MISFKQQNTLKIMIIAIVSFSLFSLMSGPSCNQTETPDTNTKMFPYFNDAANESTMGMDTALANIIKNAKESVSVAFYSCNLYEFRDALITAKKNGAMVRFITDYDNYSDSEQYSACYKQLEDAGITIITEKDTTNPYTPAESHNKFAIIDNLYLWTGSVNVTLGNIKYCSNDAVRFESTCLINYYLAEFNEMWGSSTATPNTSKNAFGYNKSATTRPASCDLAEEGNLNDSVEVCFDPSDNCTDKIVDAIYKAKDSIDFAISVFTEDDIANALIDVSRRVKVRGVFDKDNSNISGSEYSVLYGTKTIDAKINQNMCIHHKFMVIDGNSNDAMVITGSKNWTAKSDTFNDENTVIIHSSYIGYRYQTFFDNMIWTD